MAYVPPLNGGRLNASISGNTAGAGSLLSTGTMYLAGGNNITLSQNGASITISGANAPSGSINFSAGSTSNNLASVTFANSNGISFGLNGSTITASHNGITSQSNQTLGIIQGMIAGVNTLSAGSVNMSASNGITFGLNGTVLTASHNALTSQSNQTVGFYATGNTTGQSSSTSLDARSLTFNGLGNVSVGYSNGSVQISGSGGGGGIALSASGSSYSSGTVQLSAAGGALTISGSTNSIVSFSVPASSSLVGTNGVSLSSAGNTISIDGAALKPGTISNWEPIQLQNASLAAGQIGASSVLFMKLQPQAYITATQLFQAVSMSINTTLSSSHRGTLSIQAGIYTVTGSTLSLITQSSGSASYSWSNATANNASILTGMKGITLPMNINASPGNYWIGLWSNTSVSATNLSSAVGLSNRLIQFMSVNGTYAGMFGSTSGNATVGVQEGVGIFSSATAALPSSAGMSNIIQSLGSVSSPYLAFKNITW